mmetsp:Transcript_26957/g.23831  ORF Transcript_26957/g.23831 Transcript_26957/m.23831 type:complete len:228 (+) Transcript_26957:1385-2068(+)
MTKLNTHGYKWISISAFGNYLYGVNLWDNRIMTYDLRNGVMSARQTGAYELTVCNDQSGNTHTYWTNNGGVLHIDNNYWKAGFVYQILCHKGNMIYNYQTYIYIEGRGNVKEVRAKRVAIDSQRKYCYTRLDYTVWCERWADREIPGVFGDIAFGGDDETLYGVDGSGFIRKYIPLLNDWVELDGQYGKKFAKIACDDNGNLFASTEDNLLYKYTPSDTPITTPESV